MIPTLDAPAPQAVTKLSYPTLDELTDLLPRRLPNPKEAHRFLTKLEVGPVPTHRPDLGPCLLWTAACAGGRHYGVFRGGDWMPGGRRLIGSHIWLHMLLHGPVPSGHELDHICHEPTLCTVPVKDCPHRRCVLHTEVKTIAENRLRANHMAAINAAKTRCAGEFAPRAADGTIIGHDLMDPANVYIAPNGERKCRPCQYQRDLRWQRKARRLKAAAKERELREAGYLELVAG